MCVCTDEMSCTRTKTLSNRSKLLVVLKLICSHYQNYVNDVLFVLESNKSWSENCLVF